MLKVSAFNCKDLIASKQMQMLSIELPSIKRIHQITFFPSTMKNLFFPSIPYSFSNINNYKWISIFDFLNGTENLYYILSS